MWDKLKQAEWVKWAPNSDVVMALLTEAWMIAAYYTMTHTASLVFILFGFILLTNLIVNVLLPTYWVVGYRKQPLSELGITTRHWLPSLILSLLMAGFAWRSLWPLLAGKDWVPHVLYCVLALWEPFFVHSWLQLRFERAFGILPGILLASLGLAAYHIGTYPPQFVLNLFVVGVVYGVLFRLTRNLLVLWPLAWGVAGALGTAQGGFFFDWTMVPTSVVLLVIQLGFIAYMGRRRARVEAANEAGTIKEI
jgi:hypothetical protein